MSCTLDIGKNNSVLSIRVNGYASFVEATEISHFLDVIKHIDGDNHNGIVFDLEFCSKMDSTFMGLIASLACLDDDSVSVCVANCQGEALKCLEDLGLTQIVDMEADYDTGQFEYLPLEPSQSQNTNPEDVVRMSHETLSDLNEKNKERFAKVLEALRLRGDRK